MKIVWICPGIISKITGLFLQVNNDVGVQFHAWLKLEKTCTFLISFMVGLKKMLRFFLLKNLIKHLE